MIVYSVSIGNELLRGDISDTNINYIAKKIFLLGLSIKRHMIFGDDHVEIEKYFNIIKNEKCIVLISGGLGPTDDDITREVIANVAKKTLIIDNKAYEDIIKKFKKFKLFPTQNNECQAMLPKGAFPFYNSMGTAPGFAVKTGKAVFCFMPGVPTEMKTMLDKSVLPYIKKNITLPISDFIKTFKLFGIGESAAASKLGKNIYRDADPRVDITVNFGQITLKLITSRKKGYKKKINLLENLIKSELGKYIYSEKDISLSEVFVEKMREMKLKFSAAESCTGGLLSATIMDIPGASFVFEEGVVTYSNEAKIRNLGVRKSTLEKFGAVSEQTAKEMALGILKNSSVDLTCATTGIAGPDGGSKKKPVGTVCFGFAYKGHSCTCSKRFLGNRNTIRNITVNFALKFLVDLIGSRAHTSV